MKLAGDDKINYIDAGEVGDETENEPRNDDADEAKDGTAKSGRCLSHLFFVTTGEEVRVTAGDKHKKENQTSNNGDDLKDIVKETFQALDGGNVISIRKGANASAGPGALSVNRRNEVEHIRDYINKNPDGCRGLRYRKNSLLRIESGDGYTAENIDTEDNCN